MKFKLMTALIYLLTSSVWSMTLNIKSQLEKRVTLAMKNLDESFKSSQPDENIISIYQQITGKTPTQLELDSLRMFINGYGHEEALPLSYVIEQLLVYKNQKDELSYEDIAKDIDLIETLDPYMSPSVGILKINSIQKSSDPDQETKSKINHTKHTEKYKPYFGFLHAHSELSDGKGTATQAYTMARYDAQMDFFALTDHAELLHFWPWKKKYRKLKKAANKFNEDGKFAALYGFEWSHPLLGHFNVINTKKFISALTRPTLGLMMNWLSKRPKAIGRFNHPGRENMKIWPYEFRKFKLYKKAIHQVAAIEMWNKNDTIQNYIETRGSFIKGMNFLDNVNLQGWFVGAAGGQDNHDADWGIRNDFRVGVWATGLSRDQIVDAYLGRRTFATEDKNAWVSFKINASQMGSRLRPGTYKLELEFGDRDGENVSDARLIKNGKLIKSYQVNDKQYIEDEIEAKDGDFFYVITKQSDGDHLLTSPIWFFN
ncbi:MAG: CehA/McbA family metallohydrolase [Bdellovibrionota bacterium]|nr:CehA/McbA family metallohydrolase [Bdellovibrionota bacterium]